MKSTSPVREWNGSRPKLRLYADLDFKLAADVNYSTSSRSKLQLEIQIVYQRLKRLSVDYCNKESSEQNDPTVASENVRKLCKFVLV